jgi:hypothetical protein
MFHQWRSTFTKKLLLGAAIALIGTLTPSVAVRAAGNDVRYAFQTINAPSAGNTVAMANNASGDVVGYFTDANKVYHGFLLRGGAFTTLDYPGADVAWSQAGAINDAGDIAGSYSLKTPAPAGNVHGFLRTAAGQWSNVDYPEGTHLMQGGAYGILADGTVLGCYHDGNPATAMFGYTKGPKGVTTQSYPQATPFSMHYSATPDGKTTVGAYLSGANQLDNWHGYLVEGGKVVSFDVPGKVGTQALGISPGRTVVGVYRLGAGTAWTGHGFVAETNGSSDPASWSFSLVDVPDAVQTVPRALNAKGELVGYYYDAAGVVHGFVATAAPAPTPSNPAAPVSGSPAPLPPSTGTGLAEGGGSAGDAFFLASLASSALAALAFMAFAIQLHRKRTPISR